MRDCRRAKGQCLICGSDEHQVPDCPRNKNKPALPALPAPPVRRNNGPVGRGAPLPPQNHVFNQAQRRAGRGAGQAYNLTTEETDGSTDVVAGNILIHSVPVLALFDSGASHCFISYNFAIDHDIPIVSLDNPWDINTGNGVITTNSICKSCIVDVSGRKLEVDLFVLKSEGYKVILGMSWLSKHHAVIDCRNKSVTFKIPNQPEFQYIPT